VVSLSGRPLPVLPHAVEYSKDGQEHHSHVSRQVDGVAGMIFRTVTRNICPAVLGSVLGLSRKTGVGLK
jgi:hypothetical protein